MQAIDMKTIPDAPGIYIFKDGSGRVLYVGKAKRIRRRLASYFRPVETLTPKTRAMMSRAESIDTIQTGTEKEALLLEASLIKKHRPRYNIVLRDDKSYVLFHLDKNTDYPRLVLTRKVVRGRGGYYGPFTSAGAAKETWKAVHSVFPLRRCKDSAFKNRVRPCIYHQIGLCLAPCVLEVDKDEYQAMVRKVELLLSGRSRELIDTMRKAMRQASDRLEFEEAARLRDQIAAVEKTVERQAAVLERKSDLDAIGLAEDEHGLALGLLFIRQGSLLDKKSYYWPGLGLAEGPEALAGFLIQYYGPGRFIPPRIVAPWDLNLVSEQEEGENTVETLSQILSERRGGEVLIKPPRTGVEKRLVEMARANGLESARNGTRDAASPGLAAKFGLKGEPDRIECVDISHTGGEGTRAGMVVFENQRPAKDQYRIYAITGPAGPGDDYAALAEWAGRRIESGPPWPDLLLIDGGKGQLAAVKRILDHKLGPKIWPLASIAKARDADADLPVKTRRRSHALEDRIFIPGRKNPLPFKPGSPELLFLQRIRDAAHNFVIRGHRRARRKTVLSSELTRLPGIGPKTARLLWDRFSSLQEMAGAKVSELAAIPGIGEKKARRLAEVLAGLVA